MQGCKSDGVPLIKGEERYIYFVFIFVSDIPVLFFQSRDIDCFPFAEEKSWVENKAGGGGPG